MTAPRDPAVITPILQSWCDRLQHLEEQMSELIRLLGVSPECALLNAVAAVADGYTTATASRVGDAREWLDWFWHERDLGASPGDVTIGDQTIRVASAADLARVICMEV